MKHNIRRIMMVLTLCVLTCCLFAVSVSANHAHDWDGTSMTWTALNDFVYFHELYLVNENGGADTMVERFYYSSRTERDFGHSITEALLDEADGKGQFYVLSYAVHRENALEAYSTMNASLFLGSPHQTAVKTFALRDFVKFTDTAANSETYDTTSASYKRYLGKEYQQTIDATEDLDYLCGTVKRSYVLRDGSGTVIDQGEADEALTVTYTIPESAYGKGNYVLEAKLTYYDGSGAQRYVRTRRYNLYSTYEVIDQITVSQYNGYTAGKHPFYDFSFSDGCEVYTGMDDDQTGMSSGIIDGVQWRDSDTNQPLSPEDYFQCGHTYEVWIRVKTSRELARFNLQGSSYVVEVIAPKEAKSGTVLGGVSGQEAKKCVTIKIQYPTLEADQELGVWFDLKDLENDIDAKSNLTRIWDYEMVPLVKNSATTFPWGERVGSYEDYDIDGFTDGVRWYCVTDDAYIPSTSDAILETGKEYEIHFLLEARNGFVFKSLDDMNSISKGEGTLEAVPGLDPTRYLLFRSETIYPRSIITAIAVEPPVIGAYPSYEANIEDASVVLADHPNGNFRNGIGWYDETDGRWMVPDVDVFEADHIYYIYCFLKTADGLKFQWHNPDASSEENYRIKINAYNAIRERVSGYDPDRYALLHKRTGDEAQEAVEPIQPEDVSITCGGEPVTFTFEPFQKYLSYEWQAYAGDGLWIPVKDLVAAGIMEAEGYGEKELTVSSITAHGDLPLRCRTRWNGALYKTSDTAMLTSTHPFEMEESIDQSYHRLICSGCGIKRAEEHTKVWYVSRAAVQNDDGTVTNGTRYFQCKDCHYRSPLYVYGISSNETHWAILYGYYQDGSEKLISGPAGTMKQFPQPAPRENYKFLGWSTDPDATVVDYMPTDKLLMMDNVYFYAVWEETVDVHLTEKNFHPEPGTTLTVDIERMVEGDDALLEAYLNGGVTYQWYKDYDLIPGATGVSYTPKESDRDSYIGVGVTINGETYHSDRRLCYTKLEIVTQPMNAAAPKGQTATVTFTAKGEGLTYRWYYKNKGASDFTYTGTFKGNTYTAEMTAARAGRVLYCEVTDKYGETEGTIEVTLYIGNQATITTQPKDVTVEKNGAQAKVTVQATGDGLTYAWYYKDKGASEFVKTNAFKTNTYSVTMTDGRDGRQLYCVVTDKYGAYEKSDIVTIDKKKALSITTQPKIARAKRGETAAVTVVAEGNGLTYAWYYKERNAVSFKKAAGVTGDTFRVEMNDARDEMQIYCVVTDKYGATVKTNIVMVQLDEPVKIRVQPTSVKVAAGETAKLTVTAVGNGVSYKWYYKNKGASAFVLTNTFVGNTYTVEMNTARDGRQVYCVITDRYGNSIQSDIVTISMISNLTITKQPESVAVPGGETAKITFTASGDGLTYKWYYKNKGASAFALTKTFTGNTYTVEMNATRNGRQIYCVVTDKYGNSVKTNVVTISMRSSLAITKQPVSVTVAKGENAKVSFTATGEGLTYKWYYKNKGASAFALTKTFTGNTYTVEMNATRNGRQIYCVVTDKYGNSVKTNVVTISMSSGLAITKQPVSVTVAEGTTAKVTVTAAGDGLTYTWYYKNAGQTAFTKTTSFTGNSYYVAMNAARAGRQVYCVVKDKYGNSVKSAVVTLNMK